MVGSEHAMLPLNVKSEEWQLSLLLGYQVHISKQVDDLTTTLTDFFVSPTTVGPGTVCMCSFLVS